MLPPFHQRLLGEAALLGTEAILGRMPAPYSAALEQAIYQAVRYSILYYVEQLEVLAGQRRPAADRRSVARRAHLPSLEPSQRLVPPVSETETVETIKPFDIELW
jgi:hypothetical protein